VRILLVDDHDLVRGGLARLLTSCVEDADVFEAGDAEGADILFREQTFDVAS
jgi:DNA-binding NarL/FixJ family response regulator